MDRYPVPASPQRFEFEIKRSRFICTVTPATDKPAGLLKIESIRHEFPDASHHCWAMVAGAPPDPYHQDQSDDGEPKGTAGKPMLNVLQHSGIGNVVVVVTRYFGGTKLGAGGLVRAYTHSVSNALTQLETRIQFIKSPYELNLPYSQLDTLEHWLQSTNISVADRNFGTSVLLQLAVPEADLEELQAKTRELGGMLAPMKHIQQGRP